VDCHAHQLARPVSQAAAPRTLAVVGAGWAGLAAAVEAQAAGWAVTLHDMAPQAGGRARAVDQRGLVLDNGQHILIGAYRDTLALMRRVGIDPDTVLLRRPLALVDAQGQGLRLPAGPALVAFARAVWANRAWTVAERLAVLRGATAWLARGFACDGALTVAQLCRSWPQRVVDDFIDPLCVAALNTPAAEASATVFLRVLKDGLFGGPGSADLLLPRVDLSALLPAPTLAHLQAQGATLKLAERVHRIAPEGSGWQVNTTHFDAVVLATPPGEAARLVAHLAPEWAAVAHALRYEPIVTVTLSCAGLRLPQPMLALASDAHVRPAQFVFDRGQLGGPEGQLAFVISGAAPWVAAGRDATLGACIDQAAAAFTAGDASRWQVVALLAEKRATFRCTPGLQRPAAAIAPGLWAAGDHVAGPYPATLEGAVRSGLAAVRALNG
jgi:squalene-associated FAD-dependent desaturase